MARRTPKRKGTMKVGILGGSFDPPHLGHLAIAQRATDQLGLDRVLFIPTHRSPHKRDRNMTAARHRLAMVRLAVRGNTAFRVSALEVRKGGLSYTVETLRHVRNLLPGAELYFILGEDNLAQFHRWYRPREIAALARLVVYPRPGSQTHPRRRSGFTLRWLKGPLLDLSSSEIRVLAERGSSVRYLVPDGVHRYIVNHRLYRRPPHQSHMGGR